MSTPNISGISERLAENIASSIIKEESLAKLGASISISISEGEDATSLGFTNWHLQDALSEVSRYLLVHNCRLLYGGDLRVNGFTSILSDLINQYTVSNIGDKSRAINYFAWPIHLKLNRTDESEFKAHGLEIAKLQPPTGLAVDANTFLEPDSVANMVVWAKSLSHMRQQISDASDASVILGGRMSNYVGKMPGVLEEVLINIYNRKPLYVIGSFGGVAKAIAELLQGNQSNELTEAFQLKRPAYGELYFHWNNSEEKKIDYLQYCKTISHLGTKGLSECNGLSEDENLRLIHTPHIPEIVYLIIKGLTKIGLIK